MNSSSVMAAAHLLADAAGLQLREPTLQRVALRGGRLQLDSLLGRQVLQAAHLGAQRLQLGSSRVAHRLVRLQRLVSRRQLGLGCVWGRTALGYAQKRCACWVLYSCCAIKQRHRFCQCWCPRWCLLLIWSAPLNSTPERRGVICHARVNRQFACRTGTAQLQCWAHLQPGQLRLVVRRAAGVVVAVLRQRAPQLLDLLLQSGQLAAAGGAQQPSLRGEMAQQPVKPTRLLYGCAE